MCKDNLRCGCFGSQACHRATPLSEDRHLGLLSETVRGAVMICSHSTTWTGVVLLHINLFFFSYFYFLFLRSGRALQSSVWLLHCVLIKAILTSGCFFFFLICLFFPLVLSWGGKKSIKLKCPLLRRNRRRAARCHHTAGCRVWGSQHWVPVKHWRGTGESDFEP